MASRKNEQKFEEALKELETVVEALGGDGITLEESIQLYKKGMTLVKQCNSTIDKVEKELEVLKNEQIENDEQ